MNTIKRAPYNNQLLFSRIDSTLASVSLPVTKLLCGLLFLFPTHGMAEPGLDERPSNLTCVAPARPATTVNVDFETAFPSLTFDTPIDMVQAPNDNSRWYVIEVGGRVVSFANDDTTTMSSVVLDITGQVDDRRDGGLMGIELHPNFDSNGELFLSYTGPGSPFVSYVSSFTSSDGGASFDPQSEEILLSFDQPTTLHNNGHLVFGPDNYLYIGSGDGGPQEDPDGNAQDTDSWFGSILRIDVDGGTPYGIPSDNPFATGGGAPEIYAWGLRNPWRFNFDRATGELWGGDVGHQAWEEVDQISLGGNYGWNVREGFECLDGSNTCSNEGFVDPIAVYSHSEGCSITGGYVYRGTAIPELVGVYLYSDWCSGTVWGLFYDDQGNPDPQPVVETGAPIVSFAEDLNGEIYLISYAGNIFRLIPGGSSAPDQFPQTLSETGCFDSLNPLQPASGVIPYDINSPLWSDGASKDRFIALPDGESIHIDEEEDWEFPLGTVLIKNFHLGSSIVETRLFIRHSDGGWGGYSYEWNDQQTEATLLPAGLAKSINGQTWAYPSRAQCLQCHTSGAKRALGPETAQHNRDFTYPSTNITSNQLETYDFIGLFDAPLLALPDELPALASPDDTNASLNDRSRAYLHANCSSCHQPLGTAQSSMDLRYNTLEEDMNLCNEVPTAGDLGIPGATLLTPGDPAASIILQRMLALDVNRMPPLGTSIVDTDGTALIDAWIAEGQVCSGIGPGGNQPPVANDQSVVTTVDAPIDIILTGSDPNGDALTFIATGPADGSVVGSGASVTYTPDPGFIGTDSFTFEVSDGQDTDAGTVTITVQDDAPASGLVGDWMMDEGAGTVTADGSGNGNDGSIVGASWTAGVFGNALAFNGVDSYVNVGNDTSLDATSAVTLMAWIQITDPNQNAFMRIISKKTSAFASSGYELEYNPSRNRLTILTRGGNFGRAAADLDTGWHHVAAVVDGTDARLYVDGQDLTVDGVVNDLAANTIDVEIGRGSGGSDSTHYFNGAIDEVQIFNRALSEAEVQSVAGGGGQPPVNQPPVADDQAVITTVDTAVGIVLTGSDPNGDALTFAISAGPTNGTLTGSGASVTYTPDPGFLGQDSFTFEVSDGLEIDTGAVTITVEADGNQPPVANDQSVVTTVDAPIDLVLTGSDPNGDALTFTIGAGPTNGALTGSGASVTYTPNPGFLGQDSFTFEISDGQDTDTGTVTITVQDDAPANGLVGDWMMDEGAGTVTADSSGNGNDGAIVGAGWTAGVFGSALAFNGVDNYVSVGNDTSLDATSAVTLMAWIQIADADQDAFMRIVSKKDRWFASSGYELEYNPGRNRLTVLSSGNNYGRATVDLDTGWHHVAGVIDGTDARLYIDGQDLTTDGVVSALATNTIDVEIGRGSGGSDSSFYFNGAIDDVRIYDQALSETEIQSIAGGGQPPANQPPVADDQAVVTMVDTPIDIDLTGSDPNGDTLTFTIANGPTDGGLTGSGTSVTYTPDTGFIGGDSFTFEVNDGQEIDTGTVTITVQDDAPINGLVGDWVMDEGVGTVTADGSGNRNDGAIVGASWTAGVFGNALSFNGADNYVNVGNDTSLDATSAVTLMAWIQIADPDQDAFMRIISKKDRWFASSGYELEYNPGRNRLTVLGSGNNYGRATVDLDTGWHHVAAVIDGTDARVYVDGQDLTTDGVVSALAMNTIDVEIGRGSGGSDSSFYFNGAIDEVRIYDHALTEPEIQSIAGGQ